MNLKRNRIILLCILALLIPAAYFGHKMGPLPGLLLILGVLAGYLVAVHFLWRCPHCGNYLGKVDKVPTHCHRCEKELVNDDLSTKRKK